MLDEIVKSIKISVHDRVTSPLFGAFLISWSIFNYRLLIVLFSSETFQNKFSYIDTTLYISSFWHDLLPLFVYPLIATIGFLVLYPYPAGLIFHFWHSHKKQLKEKRQKIDGDTLLTKEESKKLRNHYENIEKEFENDILKKDNEIQKLQELVNQQQEVIEELKNELGEAKQLPRRSEHKKAVSDQEIRAILQQGTFRLYFNPQNKNKNQTKIIRFASDGKITEGNNNNEYSWKVSDGKLELVQSDGQVHSRFNYVPDSNIFTHTGDADTKSIRGQYILPEYQ